MAYPATCPRETTEMEAWVEVSDLETRAQELHRVLAANLSHGVALMERTFHATLVSVDPRCSRFLRWMLEHPKLSVDSAQFQLHPIAQACLVVSREWMLPILVHRSRLRKGQPNNPLLQCSIILRLGTDAAKFNASTAITLIVERVRAIEHDDGSNATALDALLAAYRGSDFITGMNDDAILKQWALSAT